MSSQIENIQAVLHPETLIPQNRERDVEKISWLHDHRSLLPFGGGWVLIDLRSPKEYQLGSIPGAHNIPLLDNEARHSVGLAYKQCGRSEAVALGLEHFAAKADVFFQRCRHLSRGNRGVVVYCARGGMRSQSVALWLLQLGLKVKLINGGYKAFRNEILSQIDRMSGHRKLVLNGRTGSGKTQLVKILQGEGFGVIDLEGIAQHRGSAFGALGQTVPSPSQQDFENLIVERYLRVCHHHTLLFEIESSIGPVHVPPTLRDSLRSSPMVFIEREFEERVQHIVDSYGKNWNPGARKHFVEKLDLLKKYLSGQEREELIDAINRGDLHHCVRRLLRMRYDKAYDKGLERLSHLAIARMNLSKQWNETFQLLRNCLKSSGSMNIARTSSNDLL